MGTAWDLVAMIPGASAPPRSANQPDTPSFQAGPTDMANLLITRDANYSGGSPSFVNSAIRANTTISGPVAAFEWGLLSVLTRTHGGSTGEHVAAYAQANNNAPNGKVWGAVIETHNNDGSDSSSVVGMEMDFGGKIKAGTDNVLLAGCNVDSVIRISGPGVATCALDISPNVSIGVLMHGTADQWLFANFDHADIGGIGIAILANGDIALRKGNAVKVLL